MFAVVWKQFKHHFGLSPMHTKILDHWSSGLPAPRKAGDDVHMIHQAHHSQDHQQTGKPQDEPMERRVLGGTRLEVEGKRSNFWELSCIWTSSYGFVLFKAFFSQKNNKNEAILSLKWPNKHVPIATKMTPAVQRHKGGAHAVQQVRQGEDQSQQRPIGRPHGVLQRPFQDRLRPAGMQQAFHHRLKGEKKKWRMEQPVSEKQKKTTKTSGKRLRILDLLLQWLDILAWSERCFLWFMECDGICLLKRHLHNFQKKRQNTQPMTAKRLTKMSHRGKRLHSFPLSSWNGRLLWPCYSVAMLWLLWWVTLGFSD